MRSTLTWKSGMEFLAETNQHKLTTDARSPLGQDKGMTPKELVLVGIGGCTGMDVVALLRKHKQVIESLEVVVETELTKGYPSIFSEVHILFKATGSVDPKILLQSIELSQTKYCGVSSMIAKASQIKYVVNLNGSDIGSGVAQFALE